MESSRPLKISRTTKTTCDHAAAAAAESPQWAGDFMLDFGKHKGMMLREVYQTSCKITCTYAYIFCYTLTILLHK
jgi:hypothetical protein